MNNRGIKLIPWQWQAEFEAWIDEVQASALLVSPYVARMPVEMVVDRWASRGIINSVKVQLFVDLLPDTVLRGSLEPSALLFFV